MFGNLRFYNSYIINVLIFVTVMIMEINYRPQVSYKPNAFFIDKYKCEIGCVNMGNLGNVATDGKEFIIVPEGVCCFSVTSSLPTVRHFTSFVVHS